MSKNEWRTIQRSTLESLYKTMTATAIATKYGVASSAVYYRLQAFGLTAKQNGAKHSPGPKASFVPPKEELERLYQTMSMREIAVHYGVGETVVFTRLRNYGIKSIPRSDRLKGKPKTIEHRLNMSRGKVGKHAGSNNPNWKGGVTAPNVAARSRVAYFEWKAAVFKAADYRCKSCGIEHGTVCKCCGHRVMLHAHHILPFATNPEVRYEPSNGVALCERCHNAEHDKQIG